MVKPWLRPQPPQPAPAPTPAQPATAPSAPLPAGDGYGALIETIKRDVAVLRKEIDTLHALYKAQTNALKENEAMFAQMRTELVTCYEDIRTLKVAIAALESPTEPTDEQWDDTHPPEPYPGVVPRTAKGGGAKKTNKKAK